MNEIKKVFDFEEVQEKQSRRKKVHYTSTGNSDLKVKFLLDDYADQLEKLYDDTVENNPEWLV